MTTQLELGGVVPKAKKVSPAQTLCRCGHDIGAHAGGKAGCAYGAHLGSSCGCKRFKSRGRLVRPAPASLTRPYGACDWYRGPPEIVRRLVGGWFVVLPTSAVIYLANTKIDSYNAARRAAEGLAKHNPTLAQRLVAGDANKRKAQRYRLEAALEQARVAGRDAPASATITRIASPRMKDDDNLVPSCKHLRDEIAASLGFDDSRFSIGQHSGSGGDIPLFYRQQTAGARGARGVLVEILWRST